MLSGWSFTSLSFGCRSTAQKFFMLFLSARSTLRSALTPRCSREFSWLSCTNLQRLISHQHRCTIKGTWNAQALKPDEPWKAFQGFQSPLTKIHLCSPLFNHPGTLGIASSSNKTLMRCAFTYRTKRECNPSCWQIQNLENTCIQRVVVDRSVDLRCQSADISWY